MFSSKFASLLTMFLISLSLYAQVPNNMKHTVWNQEGYGRILKIQDSTYTYFNISQYSCEPLAEGIFKGRFHSKITLRLFGKHLMTTMLFSKNVI